MGSKTIRNPMEAASLAKFVAAYPNFPTEWKWGKPHRTPAQNAYLFGVVYRAFADGLMDAGKGPVDIASLHYICAEQFLPRVAVGTMGKTRPMSTTELCKSGNENSFQNYVEQIKELAARAYQIYIPDPQEGA